MSSISSLADTPTPASTWQNALKSGLLYGGIALFIALVGLVGAFSERDVVYNVFSMGQTLLLVVSFIGPQVAPRLASRRRSMWCMPDEFHPFPGTSQRMGSSAAGLSR